MGALSPPLTESREQCTVVPSPMAGKLHILFYYFNFLTNQQITHPFLWEAAAEAAAGGSSPWVHCGTSCYTLTKFCSPSSTLVQDPGHHQGRLEKASQDTPEQAAPPPTEFGNL